MIDGLATAARDAALQRGQFVHKLRIIEQFKLATVQRAEHLAIQFAAVLIRDPICDAELAEQFAGELAAVPIAGHSAAPIIVKRASECLGRFGR